MRDGVKSMKVGQRLSRWERQVRDFVVRHRAVRQSAGLLAGTMGCFAAVARWQHLAVRLFGRTARLLAPLPETKLGQVAAAAYVVHHVHLATGTNRHWLHFISTRRAERIARHWFGRAAAQGDLASLEQEKERLALQ